MPELDNRNPLEKPVAKLFSDQKLKKIEPLTGRGISNTKFRCTTESGNKFLVRVNEKLEPELGLKRFQKAKFCSDIAISLKIPAPKVIEVGTLDSGRPYSIEAWVSKGVPADTFTKESDRIIIWKKLAATAVKLKDADLKGKQDQYDFGFGGDGPTQTWEQRLPNIIEAVNDDTVLNLTPAEKKKFTQLLKDFPLKRYPSRLCHGDLKLDNILVDEKSFEIVAILDWELARYVPSIVGELATTIEPAVLDEKKYAVPRSPDERNAILKVFGGNTDQLTRDFTIFFGADIVMNFDWYSKTISAGLRPDIAKLKERLTNYQAGLEQDIENLKTILAS